MIDFDKAGLRAYEYALHASAGDFDKAGDFYVYMVPVIQRMFARYVDRAPFDHYLMRTLRYRWRGFCAEGARKSRAVHVAETVEAGAATTLEADEGLRLPEMGRSQARGLYFLALACPGLPDHQLAEVGRVAAIPAEAIAAAAELLRRDTESLERMRARRSRAYAALLRLDWTIADELDPVRKADLVKEREGRKRSLRAAQRKVRAIKTTASHEEIAAVTGVPKGTIDSATYALRLLAEKVAA
jgi:hypothetical protein